MHQLNDVELGFILKDILKDRNVTDVMIWDGEIWVSDINKGHFKYDYQYYEDKHKEELMNVLSVLPRQIAIRMQVGYNDSQPILDGEGLFGELGQLRFNCIHENLTSSQLPAIAIRRSEHSLRINRKALLANNFVAPEFFPLIKILVESGCNIMISGQTGSGKTELLRYICRFIPQQQAIITIEDTLEAYLKDIYPDKNVLSLKSNDIVNASDLLKPCLRQNPDWICISETRGAEVVHLLEAVSTGHKLISTIHAESAKSIPSRMLEMSNGVVNNNNMYQQIFNHIDIGIYISYYNDSSGSHRQLTEVTEFYLDNNFGCHCNYLYKFDYVKGQPSFGKIVSEKIKQKIKEKKVDVSSIKGVFLNG